MSRLEIDKLHVNNNLKDKTSLTFPRRYTLTHSDTTGDLFLTIYEDYDKVTLSNWYTRFMRDEVLAEWKFKDGDQYLAIYCHVSGGLCFGWTSFRNQIFRHELPLALEAICTGDIEFFDNNPKLKESKVIVYFNSTKREYNKIENWGEVKDYIKPNI
jgi:hypothetical protein